MKNLLKKALLVFLTVAFAACSDDDDTTFTQEELTIAEIVQSNPNSFSSLLAALEKAELTATLNGSGTFTVFAPTNEAFAEFLGGLGITLEDVDKEVLKQILLNHVLGTEALSSNLSTGYVSNLADGPSEGTSLSTYVSVDGGAIKINNIATVQTGADQFDVQASNGVIHVVDKVIPLPTVVTFATANPIFSSLVAALTREDSFTFVSTLSTVGESPAPFTVFAPTDEAFGNLLTELNAPDLAAVPTDLLAQVLSYHVVAGLNVRSTDLTDGQEVPTLETGTFTVNTMPSVTITDERERMSNVIATDVQAINGVIHVVDTVLLPAEN